MHASPRHPSARPTHVRLVLGAIGFTLLTIAVFSYQFWNVDAGAARPRWDDLRWGYLALLIVCLPIETVSCAVRAWITTRILDPRVSMWTCLKGEWANVAISMLTPTQSWGGPGLVYVLTRSGASPGTAVAVMLTGLLGTLGILRPLARRRRCGRVRIVGRDGKRPVERLRSLLQPAVARLDAVSAGTGRIRLSRLRGRVRCTPFHGHVRRGRGGATGESRGVTGGRHGDAELRGTAMGRCGRLLLRRRRQRR